VGLRFTFPLPLWNKNEGGIEEALAKKERMDLEVSALARSIHLEAEAAKAEMAEWAKLLADLGNNLIPLADQQSKAVEDAFRKGQGEIQTVFRSREKRLELSVARLDALRQFHLARVRYEAALAQP
jgi:cobalt-zinc-cadmium efflux system outer membrane protein